MESDEKTANELGALSEELQTSRAVEMDQTKLPRHFHSKASQIEVACRWRDTQRLRDLAVSEGGLLSDEIRRKACQYLFNGLLSSADYSRRANSIRILCK